MFHFTVRFTRQSITNNDTSNAIENYPLVVDLHAKLLEQFCAELRENKTLRGMFEVLKSQTVTDNLFHVWASFAWPGSPVAFFMAMHKCYEEFGMSGNFDVLDYTGHYGIPVDQSEMIDMMGKWNAEAQRKLAAEYAKSTP